MKRIFALVVLLIGAASAATPGPPLCRVTASYRPAWTGSVLPDSFRTVTVELAQGCASMAHVQAGNYGGPHGDLGPIYTLTPASPRLELTVPSYRTFFWLSASNTPYLITLLRR